MQRLVDKRGFVLPAVIVTLVILTIISLGALTIAGDEYRAARAMRESAHAFFAAEAGLNQVWANWDSYAPAVAALAPGDSVVTAWQTLDNGDRYRATIQRLDNGGQAMYSLRAEGRSRGVQGAQRILSLAFTAGPPAGFEFGRCCEAALTIRGDVELRGNGVIDGNDAVPPGWDESCPDPGAAKPGIITDDSLRISVFDGTLDGDPPILEDTTINDSAFDQFGDLGWEELKAEADHIIDGEPELRLDGQNGRPRVQPSYTTDPISGETVCDTSDPFNWGSSDPNDPCFEHFPIILIRGEVELHEGYGQAVVIIDWDDSKPDGEKGGEFELETNFRFNGLILGKGCVEIQKGAIFHGSLFVDSNYRNEDLCGGDADYDMNDSAPEIHWSQCAVNRALVASGLDSEATPIPGPPVPLPARAFGEDIG